MAEKDVVETVYGKYYKYEIVRDGVKFYRDGKYHRGSFSSLHDAVEAAKQEG
jgi:hypothetical protein